MRRLVKFTKDALPYAAGETASFPPDKAKELVKKKMAEYVVVEESKAPAPAAPAPAAPAPAAPAPAGEGAGEPPASSDGAPTPAKAAAGARKRGA